MSNIVLIDANNVFRRMMEADHTGRPLSNIFYYVQHNTRTPIVIWDGPNALQSRRDLVPEYKMKRTPLKDDISQGFDHLRKILKLSRAIQLRIAGYEADDVIASLANHLRTTHKVYIDSNDGDFLQLGLPTSRKDDMGSVRAEWIPLYKSLVGDPSDNIKGIPGFGDKAWESLAEFTKKKMVSWLENQLPQGITDEDWTNNYVKKIIDDFMVEPEFPLLEKHIVKFAEQLRQLQKYYRIVRFVHVPMEVIDAHMVRGSNTPSEAEKIFREFMI
jgi:5'-3' exonuclease